MKDNHKSYQKVINTHEDELDFELDDLGVESINSIPRQLIPIEVDLIKSRIARLQLNDFCNDIYQALCRYRAIRNHQISKKRRLDLNALEELVANPSRYPNKELCMGLIEQRVERIKTRWYNFSRKSLLRNILWNILDIHLLPQLEKVYKDLESEMRAHEEMVKKFHLTVGEDVGKLHDELTNAKQTITVLERQIRELKENTEIKSNNTANNSNNNAGFKGKLFK